MLDEVPPIRQLPLRLSLKPIFLLFLFGLVTVRTSWATDVVLTGPWAAQITGNTSTLNVEKISNFTTGGHSGSLRLELWAFDYPYAGGAQPGYHLADYQLQSLSGLMEYQNVTSPALNTTRAAAVR